MSNERKKIFFTSDWHIGHKNILSYGNRPFNNIDEMAAKLIKRFNGTVPQDALTYFVGDMCFDPPEELKKVLDLLHGRKLLILGNHDRKMDAMYKAGFDVVLNSATLYISNQKVTVSHCPLPGIQREIVTGRESTPGLKGGAPGEHWHGESREGFRRFMVQNEGQFHLHGHIHSPNHGRSEKILGRQHDVGVDSNNYTPVSISKIESWITKTILSEST